MRVKIIISIFLLALFGLCHNAFAGEISEKPIYDMRTCIAMASKNNPLLLSAEAKKLSANAALNYQKALFRPTLDFNIGSGYISGRSTSPFAVARGIDEEDLRVRTVSEAYYTGSLLFDYSIYKEGVLLGNGAPSVKKAEAQLGVASDNLSINQNEAYYNIIDAYLGVLKVKEDIKTEEENIRYLQSTYDMSVSKYNLSLMTKEELLKVESQLVTAEESLANNKNILIQKKIALAYWIGIDPSSEFGIADVIDNSFYYTSIPISNLKDLIGRAYEKNPLISLQNNMVKSAKEELTIAEKKRYPNVSLTADLSTTGDYNPKVNTQFRTLLELTMPILDFGRTKFSIEDASHKLKAVEMDLLNAKNSLAKDIMQKVMDIKNLENSITAMKKGIESAQESYNHMLEGYAQNIVTLSVVLEAQYNLISAKNALNQLTYDHRLNYARLKGFIGELLSY